MCIWEYYFCFFLPYCQPSFPPRDAIWWTPLICCPRLLLDVNLAGHTEQGKGFSPVCILSWLASLVLHFIIFEQNLHFNLGSSCVISWLLTLLNVPNRIPQCLQLYFSFFEWDTILCHFKRLFVLNVSEHSAQGYSSSSWTDLMWWVKAVRMAYLFPHLSQ